MSKTRTAGRKKTDIEKVREVALLLLYIEPEQNEKFPFILTHPVFDSIIVGMPKGEMINITEGDNLRKVQAVYADIIKKADLNHLTMIIRAPYHFAFLKFSKPYLSKEDFDKYLAYMWVNCENPNQDKNVNIKTFISWFSKADKKILMEEDEYEYYCELPEEIDVYRGVAVGRAEAKGLSWTCNYKTAEWFASRFNEQDRKGYILKGKIRKEEVFAYFNGRNEDEILCNSSKIYDIERIITSE